MLVFGTVVNQLVQGAARPVNALVRTGTVVVLFHGWLLQTLVDIGILADGAKFLLTVLISWAVGLAINATPLSPWVSGVPVPDWWTRWRARRQEHRQARRQDDPAAPPRHP